MSKDLPPAIAISQPAPPPSRGTQLRDLTQNALAVFKKRKFDPVSEFINCFEEVKGFCSTLDEENEEYIMKLMEEMRIDPDPKLVETILEKLESTKELRLTSKRLKFDILKELMQYAVPKLRSVEHTGEVDQRIIIQVGVQPKDEKVIELAPDNRSLGREDVD